MKKIVLVISMIMIFLCNSLSFATDGENIFVFEEDNTSDHTVLGDQSSEENIVKNLDEKEKNEEKIEENTSRNIASDSSNKNGVAEEITPAAQKILDNSSKKERKLAEYEDKYNDKTYAYAAYILDLIQIYSIPVCIIGIAIGAFNMYIIGEKKLDKREKGFALVMGFMFGLVIFQVLPLAFALLAVRK